MEGSLIFSQSSLLLTHPSPLHTPRQAHLISCRQTSPALTPLSQFLSTKLNPHVWTTRAHVVSDSNVLTTFTVDSASGSIDILPDMGGSGDNFDGNDGGGGDKGGNNDGSSGENKDQGGSHGKKPGMSMSQKLTLGYAVLVGIGGLMGYLKSGSKKSLIAGGLSALVLYCVYTMLPWNPVFGSSVGFGLSAALLGVMGSRFKKSGKIFPSGVVALVSLVMSGGYLHGLLRSLS